MIMRPQGPFRRVYPVFSFSPLEKKRAESVFFSGNATGEKLLVSKKGNFCSLGTEAFGTAGKSFCPIRKIKKVENAFYPIVSWYVRFLLRSGESDFFKRKLLFFTVFS